MENILTDLIILIVLLRFVKVLDHLDVKFQNKTQPILNRILLISFYETNAMKLGFSCKQTIILLMKLAQKKYPHFAKGN